jgi:hypothetical protein
MRQRIVPRCCGISLSSEAVLDGMKTMVEKPASDIGVEQIWVNVTEATGITGYSRVHVQKLARDNWKLPEAQRLIRIRKRSSGYDIWLPDLVNYIENHGLGPYPPRQSDSTN